MSSDNLTRRAPTAEEQTNEEHLVNSAMELGGSMITVMVLKSAMDLNLLEILAGAGDQKMSSEEIARRIPTWNPEAPAMLDRMLRLLASYNVVTCEVREESGERLYDVAPMGRVLMKKNREDDGSVGPMFLLLADHVFFKSWQYLNDAIIEGGNPFHKAYGMTVFEYARTVMRINQKFNDTMSDYDAMIMKKALKIYKGFDGINLVVDVGGGLGATLNHIVSKYPSLKGINFDLPHVVKHAPSYLDVQHVAGVPCGDAILLKCVPHDWDDEHCMKVLRNCKESLGNTGKVIVMEKVLPVTPNDSKSSRIAFASDMFMLTQMPGGKERTQNEFQVLAIQSGFSSFEMICCSYDQWIIELRK